MYGKKGIGRECVKKTKKLCLLRWIRKIGSINKREAKEKTNTQWNKEQFPIGCGLERIFQELLFRKQTKKKAIFIFQRKYCARIQKINGKLYFRQNNEMLRLRYLVCGFSSASCLLRCPNVPNFFSFCGEYFSSSNFFPLSLEVKSKSPIVYWIWDTHRLDKYSEC